MSNRSTSILPCFALLVLFLHTNFMEFKVALGTSMLTVLILTIIDEILERNDQKYHAEYETDGKKNNNENML